MDALLRGLAEALINADVAEAFGGADSWAVFLSRLPPKTPDAAIAIVRAGGFPDNPKWAVDYPSVQVLVRGDKNDSDAAYDKIKGVKDTLLGRASGLLPTVSGITSEYVDSITMMGNILPLGYDESQRVLYSINFRLIVEPNNTGNRTAL